MNDKHEADTMENEKEIETENNELEEDFEELLNQTELKTAFFQPGQEIEADIVLSAVGIAPNIENIGLEELGIDVKREDIRFIIDVVGEQDPWFEQGASATVFASRFRNFVISRCQEAGMQLSADEVDLIDAWFASGITPTEQEAAPAEDRTIGYGAPAAAQSDDNNSPLGERTARWWQETSSPREGELAMAGDNDRTEEFPRIVRNRLKA